MKFEAKTV